MLLALHNLHTTKKRRRKRVGRGNASLGSYSGRGVKGQRARTGGKKGLKLMGLKQSLMKLKKQGGFTSSKKAPSVVNVGALEKFFNEGAIVDPKVLIKKGLIPTARFGVKILGEGKLNKKLTVKAHRFSKSAQEMITKSGGTAEVLKKEGTKQGKKAEKAAELKKQGKKK